MRVAPLPLHAAATPWPPTLKTVLSLPLERPTTGPSKVNVSEIDSPTLLPAAPDTVVAVIVGGVATSVGAVVSTTGSALTSMAGMSPACTKAFPAASRMPSARAALSAASSMTAGPFCPAAMV